MINEDKWVNSLNRKSSKFIENANNLDHDKWINTIPKKKSEHSVKKYSLMTILFISGLLFVSAVKNETRNIEKEISNLEASIGAIKFNLDQAILDNEVITSPENIFKLAKEHLNIDLGSYKKSQIIKLHDKEEKIEIVNKIKKKENSKIKNLKENTKLQIAKKIEKKREEIKKLQDLYNKPEAIPDEIKVQVVRQIKEKKTEIENIYNSPAGIFTFERVSKWSIIQVVKVFLGIPVVPGR